MSNQGNDYAILFEPVKIGPVTAPNRFYQVPHCNGMGHRNPSGMAAMRGVKAEGGWGVVCTEVCEIHHTGDVTPNVEARLWDDRDIPALARMTEAVHKHGSLAGVQLGHHGMRGFNRTSREVSMGPSSQPMGYYEPHYSRVMGKRDIQNLRRWHKAAALRAKRAGFDLVYVYAAHGLTVPFQFLSRRFNSRTDEYGGLLENRVRLLRELIEDTKEAIGDACAVAVRLSVDELAGPMGIVAEQEGRDIVEMLAELPDLWDVNVAGWDNDSVASRFASENFQEPYISFVKKVTTKPVVAVGRVTSPDTMKSMVCRGVVDLIGAARPSIADPFLPKKIQEDRLEEIRECIGCNICVTGDFFSAPIRCTQNPTMGEEWRRGWHPEKIPVKQDEGTALVIGAGPAGMECARALAARGYSVALAEAGTDIGGRVTLESTLPGLSEWVRVKDYREHFIKTSPNIDLYLGNRLSAEEVLELGFMHVVVATGSRWRKDGVGRVHKTPIQGWDSDHVVTPDDILAGAEVTGTVVVYDDDHYYMGGALAEKLRLAGCEVYLVTPAPQVSQWTTNTMEQGRIQVRLMELDVHIVREQKLLEIGKESVTIGCVFTGKTTTLAANSLVMVASRTPSDQLYQEVMLKEDEFTDKGIASVTAIGDCLAPGTIAAAVYAGHKYARELGEDINPDEVPFQREIAALSEHWP